MGFVAQEVAIDKILTGRELLALQTSTTCLAWNGIKGRPHRPSVDDRMD